MTTPFVCLDAPASGAHVARGGTLTVRGYAGGSFESNVVVDVRPLTAGQPGAAVVMRPLTYSAPDIGMPGGWQIALAIPAGATPGPARVTAHFESPRDGSTVAQASIDIVID